MKPLLILIAFLLVVSCNQKVEKKTVVEIVETTEESHESIDEEVSLNNGELWLANPETTEGINKMKKRMVSFKDTENQEAYSILKTGLEEDFTELFEKCTMKGEAHHQLHNYLFPLIDLFDNLESSDLTVCKNSFKDLNLHLDTYFSYFK